MRPVGATVAMIEESGLEVRDVHALREHYVRTVDAWYETFESRWDEVVAMVGEEVSISVNIEAVRQDGEN